MTRCEIIQDQVKIAYGDDDFLGYFFSVEDARVSWAKDATQEMNTVAESVAADGGGSYLSLTTGLGIGKRISAVTMAGYMRRYGVPDPQIEKMFRGQPMAALPKETYRLVRDV
ncbi:hypothetical protein K488DRAFT_88596 [Vararia minispora EC-137]|uniref:Uncharacterized protein n=1 Tax=Vararia minispora EC-137 TaxID=1314806 RepID=A0ACB8QCN3_9AGAM|nr:hypothetical protein K488DRAFT_88596 [Vararia minispora EC-137]